MESSRASAKILVVEDETLQRSYFAEILGDAGYEVLSAATSDRALETLKQADGSLRVVITDVQMPGLMDGLALAKTIRRQWPGVGVIIVSGFNQSAAAMPADVLLLHKPVNETLLLKLVKRMTTAGIEQASSSPS